MVPLCPCKHERKKTILAFKEKKRTKGKDWNLRHTHTHTHMPISSYEQINVSLIWVPTITMSTTVHCKGETKPHLKSVLAVMKHVQQHAPGLWHLKAFHILHQNVFWLVIQPISHHRLYIALRSWCSLKASTKPQVMHTLHLIHALEHFTHGLTC